MVFLDGRKLICISIWKRNVITNLFHLVIPEKTENFERCLIVAGHWFYFLPQSSLKLQHTHTHKWILVDFWRCTNSKLSTTYIWLWSNMTLSCLVSIFLIVYHSDWKLAFPGTFLFFGILNSIFNLLLYRRYIKTQVKKGWHLHLFLKIN